MSDIQLQFGTQSADLVLVANDLSLDEGLETAIVVSLFTDRRAHDSDVPSDGTDDRRGWWADALPAVDGDLIGSRLWLLAREKQQASVLDRAKTYAIEALQWLVDDGIAASIDVVTEFTRPGLLGLQIQIHRPNASALQFTYSVVWAAQAVAA